MKPSTCFILGILLCIALFIPALIFSSLLHEFFESSGIAVFYQIIQIASTITCTCVIVNKLNQMKDKDN